MFVTKLFPSYMIWHALEGDEMTIGFVYRAVREVIELTGQYEVYEFQNL